MTCFPPEYLRGCNETAKVFEEENTRLREDLLTALIELIGCGPKDPEVKAWAKKLLFTIVNEGSMS